MSSPYCCFTVCNLAYLYKALALAESVYNYQRVKLNIYLFDKKRALPDFVELANVIWIEDLAISDFKQLAFKYDITELSTSLKPRLALDLLSQFEKVIFLDPDTFLFNSIDRLLDTLEREEIILTPHYTTPQESGTDLCQSDLAMMRFGSFNMGFFAVRKSLEALRFLGWWDDRCRDLCFFETQFGLSTDQKWVSIAPCFFPTLHISFDLGLNVAFWNLHERKVTSEVDGKFVINEKFDLAFFHFSSFCNSNPLYLTERPFRVDISDEILLHKIINIYAEVSGNYKERLKHIDQKYSYDYLSDNSYISPTLRRAYACVINKFHDRHDPFDVKGVVGDFARKNRLLVKINSPYKSESYGDIKNHTKTFECINMGLRFLLYIWGPTKFSNLSRLFVYLSSYRQVDGLWKL